MAYGETITVKKMIERIDSEKYVLPSIQRAFVWNMGQIEKLFDSLMRDYPVGTFLFWGIDKENVNDFEFYYFLEKYHEKHGRLNKKANLPDTEDVTAILDGQQRMTSLYLGLKGSYSKRKRHGRIEDEVAYIERKLYLNLLKNSDAVDTDHGDIDNDDIKTEYELRFLTDAEAKPGEGCYWFECGEILNFKGQGEVLVYLMKTGLLDSEKYSQKSIEFSCNTLANLFETVHDKAVIRYYLEDSKELDKVLQIFIRTNSAGTMLSHSDLLFSMVAANWDGADGREIINDFVNDINDIGRGFSFNKDFVLKACLVLCDGDVRFKVDNFKQNRMSLIGEKWHRIDTAIRDAVRLAALFGYDNKSLSSKNAIIPIAYYLYKNNIDWKELFFARHKAIVKSIREWLARVLLSGAFGGATDSVYPPMRKLINDDRGTFPLQKIINHYKGTRKSISFSEADIDNLLEESEVHKIDSLLALLHLDLDINPNQKYRKVNIHPKTYFNFDRHRANEITNLRLALDKGHEVEISEPFKVWLYEAYPEKKDRKKFLESNYIGDEQFLEVENFSNFHEERKEKIKAKLMQVLGVKPDNTEGEAT